MNTPHPTDEQLSAALDGEDPGAARHASGCEVCALRLEQLRAVAGLIGSPVGDIDDMARERAVRLAVAGSGRADRRPLVLGIAAAILLVLIAVPLALRSGNDQGDTVASSAADESAQVVGGDLGSLSDPQELRAWVAGGLGDANLTAGATGASSGSGAGADESAKTASTTTTGAGGTAVAGAPQALSRDSVSNSSGAPGSSATPPCAAVTKKTYGKGLGPLVYAATLTWQGTPAVVLGYSVPGASTSLDRRVFVMSRASCTLLLVFST
jgi:hypothetical protein